MLLGTLAANSLGRVLKRKGLIRAGKRVMKAGENF